jgi:hypothetical protein
MADREKAIRFDLCAEDGIPYLGERVTGMYVRFADYAAAESRLSALTEENAALRNEIAMFEKLCIALRVGERHDNSLSIRQRRVSGIPDLPIAERSAPTPHPEPDA